MKVVQQSAQLIGMTLPVSYNEISGRYYNTPASRYPEKLIELAGRTCYKSEDKITDTSADPFIEMICKRNHESVLEHVSIVFKIVTDRRISHQLVRHRIASYSQESTRYCNYSKDKFGRELSVIKPTFPNAESEWIWEDSVKNSEQAYFELLDNGCKPEDASSVLPGSLKTEIVMSTNVRVWKHVISVRMEKAAHPLMRQLAVLINTELVKALPVVFKSRVL